MSYKKQIFKLDDLKKFLTEKNSCISLMPTVRLLALPPFFLNDMKSGILYLLNNMLKKYDRSLGGIVIGYQNIKVLMDENTGIIPIGTSETEVNISVEFYIFQPRIGSYLEGVVNKKSNNHIGCLVHKYFNATILKPDDIDYEDWICKDFNVDDKIIFKVKDLDFTSLLPYIEGDIGNKTILDNNKYNIHKNCDTDSLMVNNLKKSNEKEISLAENFLRNEETLDEKSDDDILESKKIKNGYEKVSILEGSVIKNSGKIDSFTNLRKKKKKKEKEEKKLSILDDSNCSKKDKYFNNEVTSDAIIFDQANESQLIEKKKRKKKSGDIGRDGQEATVEYIEVNSNHIDHTVLEKLVPVEDENSCDFIKPFKKKKEKKKDGEKPQIFNKISQGLSSSKVEDNVLYSTLLDPFQSEKMRISFCSPIPQVTPVGQKKSEINLETHIIEELNISEQQSFKGNKDTKIKVNKRKEIFKEKVRENSSEVNKISKDQKNCLNKDDKKSEVQNILDELLKQEINRVKNNLKSSETGSIREEKEVKAMVSKQETLREESHLSLYEKLLNEAKSTIELGKDKLQNSVPVKELRKNKNMKDSYIPDFFTSSSKKEDLGKKKKHNKEKAEVCHHMPDKYRNGSMNDASATPEKVKPGKSLFSDSEQNHTSRVKRIKEANGVEAKLGKSLVQNMLDEFCKEERKRLQSESDKESLIGLKKQKKKGSKSEQKSQNSSEKQESLYEKLLKEARSLIDSKEESPPKKKKK